MGERMRWKVLTLASGSLAETQGRLREVLKRFTLPRMDNATMSAAKSASQIWALATIAMPMLSRHSAITKTPSASVNTMSLSKLHRLPSTLGTLTAITWQQRESQTLHLARLVAIVAATNC